LVPNRHPPPPQDLGVVVRMRIGLRTYERISSESVDAGCGLT
jgi:hypothetical protein